jgi:hypothetical protein
MHPDTPVIVEWYTFEHIPRVHHVLIMTYANAMEWVKDGVKLRYYIVDPLLYDEFPYEREPRSDGRGR